MIFIRESVRSGLFCRMLTYQNEYEGILERFELLPRGKLLERQIKSEN